MRGGASTAIDERPSRWPRALGIAAVAVTVLHALWLSATRPFALDELTYAHQAFQIHSGLLPYRDFFAHHTPLLWQLTAPLHALVGSAPGFLAAVRWALVPVWLTQLALLYALVRPFAGRAAVLAPLAASMFPVWLDHAIELRPDPLATTAMLAAFWLLGRAGARRSPVASAAAGALAVLACWASPKAGVYGMGLGLAFVLSAVGRLLSWRRGAAVGGAAAAWFPAPTAFLAGVVAVLAAIGLWLAQRDLAEAFWRNAVQWPMAYESSYEGFPFWPRFRHHVYGLEAVLAIAAYGWLVLLAEVRTAGRVPAESADAPVAAARAATRLPLLAFLPLAVVSVAAQSAAYAYSYLPILAGVAALFAIGVAHAAAQIRQHAPRWLPWAGALWVVLLLRVGVDTFGHHGRAGAEKRAQQFAVLHDLERLVPPDVPVYDNTGQAVRRPAVHYYGFTNPWIRESTPEMLVREMPAAIRERGCVAMLVDSVHGRLPPELERFLAETFQPWDGDIWLWGRHLRAATGEPGVHAHLEIVRDGHYRIVRAEGSQAEPVTIDAEVISGDRVALTAGHHVVRTAATEVYVLWEPADGRPWRPRPGQRPRLFHVL